jgi:glycosyltransferase involved in cell wall biosynthesis
VNDGSTDGTEELMRIKAVADTRYQCVFLSRNHGHQRAISAGLSFARATEAVMVIDGDLQDPPELLSQFYEKFKEGYDVVYAIRKKRKEVFWKRAAYHLYYRLLVKISKIDLPLDSGDFALISRRLVDLINKMPEESRYLRGLRSWLGFNQIGIEYERAARQAGETKYSLKMLLGLAYNGIFNFSSIPIKIISFMGLGAVLVSVPYLMYNIYLRLFTETIPAGFTALLFVIILFGGVQLLSIGILGEYLLRVFFQVKNRPLFIVEEHISNQQQVKVEDYKSSRSFADEGS